MNLIYQAVEQEIHNMVNRFPELTDPAINPENLPADLWEYFCKLNSLECDLAEWREFNSDLYTFKYIDLISD